MGLQVYPSQERCAQRRHANTSSCKWRKISPATETSSARCTMSKKMLVSAPGWLTWLRALERSQTVTKCCCVQRREMSYLAGSTTPKPYESKDGAFTSQQRSILEILNRSFSRLSRLLAPCKFDVDVRAMLTLKNQHFDAIMRKVSFMPTPIQFCAEFFTVADEQWKRMTGSDPYFTNPNGFYYQAPETFRSASIDFCSKVGRKTVVQLPIYLSIVHSQVSQTHRADECCAPFFLV